MLKMDKWYEKSGQNVGTAVSTRIKISRNIKGYPFPNKMNSEQQRAVNKTVYAALFLKAESLMKMSFSGLKCRL